jgi:uncharacterized membrane protein
MGDMGVVEKQAMATSVRTLSTAVVFVAAVAAICLTADMVAVRGSSPPSSVVAPAPEVIPDAAGETMSTNRKLDEVNANLAQLNAKLQEILDLLRSGKLEVTSREAAPKPADGNGGKGVVEKK